MKKLGTRNYAIIVQGIKAIGTFDPNEMFFIFEEQLYMDEADTIWNFLEWCHQKGKNFGRGNYEQVFKEFLNG